jgi:hypothetical protein
MQSGNVFSLVKRTLFEANSNARRIGKASLTSAQTSRLLLATPQIVNPAEPNIKVRPGDGSHACGACKIVSRRHACVEQTVPLSTVATPLFVPKDGFGRYDPPGRRNQAVNEAMNDNEGERPVIIITGRVWRRKGGKAEGVHVMLVAPDDDSAVRRALESLAAEGYAEAELDQIGEMQGAPDEEPHLSAWQGALEGEVSIVTFDEPD